MIWVTGGNGMLGSELVEYFKHAGISCVSTDSEVDITDMYHVRNFVKQYNFTHIINCAAYTHVDKAESDITSAYSLNVLGPENLAITAKEEEAVLIHYSTDYVFNGDSSECYSESSLPGPLNVYGSTKYLGEIAIQRKCSDAYIIRTAWLYGKNGSNFVKTILNVARTSNDIYVVDDQFGSPTHTLSLIKFTKHLLDKSDYGTYHFTNRGSTSWYEFAKAIQEFAKKYDKWPMYAEILPTKTVDGDRPAKRPVRSLLSKKKIKDVFNYQTTPWTEELEEYIKEF